MLCQKIKFILSDNVGQETVRQKKQSQKQRRQSGLKSVGLWIRVKKFRFSRKISEKFGYFQAISHKKIDFSGQIFEKF